MVDCGLPPTSPTKPHRCRCYRLAAEAGISPWGVAPGPHCFGSDFTLQQHDSHWLPSQWLGWRGWIPDIAAVPPSLAWGRCQAYRKCIHLMSQMAARQTELSCDGLPWLVAILISTALTHGWHRRGDQVAIQAGDQPTPHRDLRCLFNRWRMVLSMIELTARPKNPRAPQRAAHKTSSSIQAAGGGAPWQGTAVSSPCPDPAFTVQYRRSG